jgi:integral membrane protein (TIGR00529 family)
MFDAFLAAPVIVKVLGSLAFILVMSRFFRELTISVCAGALLLALWSGLSASQAATVAWQGLSSADTLLLVVIVFQVIWLSSQMAATGMMEDLVQGVSARVSARASMAVLPAVIGLLPMPGGALFSAPLVDSVDTAREVSPSLKAQTNHWFRHVWEYWWPLYPGVLLAMQLTRLDVWQFVLLEAPLTLGAVAAGWWFVLRRVHAPSASPRRKGEAPGLFKLLLPIIVVVTVYGLVRGGWALLKGAAALPDLNRYVPMLVGLCAAMLVLQAERPMDRRQWQGILLSGRAGRMVLVVLAVLVYGAFIKARLPGQVPLVEQMRAQMQSWGIPLMGIVMVLPFVSGLATGLSVGFVGASFPIVISLMGPDPSAHVFYPTVLLAYAFGYMGMLISPVHVCLIVTSQHFETYLLHNMAALARPALVTLAWALLLYAALGFVFP